MKLIVYNIKQPHQCRLSEITGLNYSYAQTEITLAVFPTGQELEPELLWVVSGPIPTLKPA